MNSSSVRQNREKMVDFFNSLINGSDEERKLFFQAAGIYTPTGKLKKYYASPKPKSQPKAKSSAK